MDKVWGIPRGGGARGTLKNQTKVSELTKKNTLAYFANKRNGAVL